MKKVLSLTLLLSICTSLLQAQLIINEVSQGPSGSQEYVELLVIGNPTCASSTVDIRGWIIDDNNSWHASGSGNGIASGHKRFSSAAQWANVRMGSIIVIYNESDPNPSIPADDETDSNHDCVYILPGSSTYLDHNTTMPTGTLTFTTYLGSPYTATGNWSSLSMNNTNDAFHTVSPLAINSPYHAIGWGTNVDSNDVYFSGGMSNRVVRFTNSIDNNPFNAANFLRDTVLSGGSFESPGAPNSLANAAYINYMKNSCLPFTSIAVSIDTAICNGDRIFAGGTFQTTAGSYYDTLRGAGCDTIRRTNLSIIPSSTMSQSISICFGETTIINGIPRSVAGLYRDTLTSYRGCDSIINTTLVVDTIKTFTRNVSICNGESFFAGGAFQNTSGMYYDSLIANSGCDSILTTNLTVNTFSTGSFAVILCSGECYFFGGANRCAAGTYFDTLINSRGCDSIVQLNVTIANNSFRTITTSICNNETYTFNGTSYTTSGTYYDTLTNSSGCDSIVTINLTVNPISTFLIDSSMCNGLSIRIGTNVYNTNGNRYDTLINYLGCDSIVHSILTFYASSFTRSLSICTGDSVLLGGRYRTTPGSYYDTLVNYIGCDSVLRTNLAVFPVNNIIENRSLCLGDAYNGVYYMRDTSWNVQTNNRFGCDSSYTLNITISPNPSVIIGPDTCITEGQSITLIAYGAIDYFWSTGTNSNSITVSPSSTTSYFVRGINVQLCSGYDTIEVCVNPYNDTVALAIPNAFTPNKDGLNDIFKILGSERLTLGVFRIFNRWGGMLFETNNIEKGWDGMYNEREQPLGTYVYYIEAINTVNGRTHKYTGTVTLLR